MKKSKALETLKQFEAICKEKGLWNQVRYENRPKLKTIIVEISIKIDSEGDNSKIAYS